MVKRKSNGEIPPDNRDTGSVAPNGGERDFVTFYSRLTHTLENACSRDALSRRLAELRHATPDPEGAKPPLPALTRTFRRLGLINADGDVEAFTEQFAKQVGEAVTQPERHVLLLLRLFSLGDEALPLKPVCGATPQCQSCQLTRECEYFNNPRKPEMATLTPAARLMEGNDQMLSDMELLSVLLHGDRATGQEPVVSTIMARYGRLLAVFRADGHEFSGIRDVTKAQALRMAAIAALHRRLLAERRGETLRITMAKDIHDRYAPELRDYRVEAAVLLMLDQQNNVMRDAWFCEGSPTIAHIAIADLLRPAVREFATRIALVHNHPSGDPSPSLADLDFTRRLRAACDIIGIGLVDHVIVSENGYHSFAENGMLGG